MSGRGVAGALLLAIAALAPTARAEPSPVRPEERQAPYALESVLAPLRLHVPAHTPEALARRWLADLEWAAARAAGLGWPAPLLDGARGGSASFDLYVVRAAASSAVAREDLPSWSVDLPASGAYGVVATSAARTDFASCAISAYVQASTWAIDPHEVAAWRRATGTFVAGVATGRLGGCTTGLADLQATPGTAWFSSVAGEPDRPDGGALLLLHMSGRHDGGTGTFIRDLWEMAPLRSDAADPDAGLTLFDVWSESLRGAGDSLRDNLVDEAVQRAALEQPWRPRVHPIGLTLESIEPQRSARVVSLGELPARLDGPTDGLEPTGSWTARVELAGGRAEDRLRVWFEGESGSEWSVQLVAYDEVGTETARLAMPVRHEPRGYLALERASRHHHVVVVVTALPPRTPFAWVDPSVDARGFRLTLDR